MNSVKTLFIFILTIMIKIGKYTGVIEHTLSPTESYKEYYVDSKLHRIDGPAVEWADGRKEYWINGKKVKKEAQELLYFFMKLKGLL